MRPYLPEMFIIKELPQDWLCFQPIALRLWPVGGETGYFVQDNLAPKVGLGYTDIDYTNFFSHKVGAKYYVSGVVPFQLDITGATLENIDGYDTPDPLWLGIQKRICGFCSRQYCRRTYFALQC